MKSNEYVYAYNLIETCEIINGAQIKLNAIPSFYSMFSDYFNQDTTEQTYWQSGNGKKLFDAVFNNHYNDIIIFADEELTTQEEYKKASKKFVYSFYAIFRERRDYYDKILNIYATKENELFNKIKSEAKHAQKFNDTPQNEYDTSEFTDDGHATNITLMHNVIESDDVNTMTRIKQIQESYKKTIAEWSKMFNKLFISGLNYGGDEV